MFFLLFKRNLELQQGQNNPSPLKKILEGRLGYRLGKSTRQII